MKFSAEVDSEKKFPRKLGGVCKVKEVVGVIANRRFAVGSR